MPPVRSGRLAVVATLSIVSTTTGCLFDPDHTIPPPPVDIPIANTPENAIRRLAEEYMRSDLAEYGLILTKDFRFTFSSQSDPTLVALYGETWGKDDELESTTHLFYGFVDFNGVLQPRARTLDLSMPVMQSFDDPGHADSLDHYRMVAIPRLRLDIALDDGREFAVDAPHRFYVVRGDAALLDPGQAASAERWYVYRWDDLSAPLLAASGPPRDASTLPTAP